MSNELDVGQTADPDARVAGSDLTSDETSSDTALVALADERGQVGLDLDASSLQTPSASADPTTVVGQREACDGGDAHACTLLGWWTTEGLAGLSPNTAEGLRLIEQGRQGQDQLGCSYSGGLYLTGAGVPMDYTRARELLVPACDAGEQLGCGWLGLLYETGTGMPRDVERAESLYRGSCEAGWGAACFQLGRLYAVGVGPVAANLTRSRGYYAQACLLG